MRCSEGVRARDNTTSCRGEVRHDRVRRVGSTDGLTVVGAIGVGAEEGGQGEGVAPELAGSAVHRKVESLAARREDGGDIGDVGGCCPGETHLRFTCGQGLRNTCRHWECKNDAQ